MVSLIKYNNEKLTPKARQIEDRISIMGLMQLLMQPNCAKNSKNLDGLTSTLPFFPFLSLYNISDIGKKMPSIAKSFEFGIINALTYFIQGPIFAIPAHVHKHAWHKRLPVKPLAPHGNKQQNSIYTECSPRDA